MLKKPFLEKLLQIGWDVIIHPNQTPLEAPSINFRNNFKEIISICSSNLTTAYGNETKRHFRHKDVLDSDWHVLSTVEW